MTCNTRIMIAAEAAERDLDAMKAQEVNAFDILDAMRATTGYHFYKPAMNGWDFLRLALIVDKLGQNVK